MQCSAQSVVQIYPGGGWTSMQSSPKTFAFANSRFTTSGASKIAFKSENPEIRVFRSQSLFVNIYQRHTVLNVISDRRQFTLKLIREWVAPLSTAWPEETKPEIFLGKETEFCSSFRIPLRCSSTSFRSFFFHFSPLIHPLSRWNRKASKILDNFWICIL